jgi:Tfp pilus assembly protein FimT
VKSAISLKRRNNRIVGRLTLGFLARDQALGITVVLALLLALPAPPASGWSAEEAARKLANSLDAHGALRVTMLVHPTLASRRRVATNATDANGRSISGHHIWVLVVDLVGSKTRPVHCRSINDGAIDE